LFNYTFIIDCHNAESMELYHMIFVLLRTGWIENLHLSFIAVIVQIAVAVADAAAAAAAVAIVVIVALDEPTVDTERTEEIPSQDVESEGGALSEEDGDPRVVVLQCVVENVSEDSSAVDV
jgi:hypothetical protein